MSVSGAPARVPVVRLSAALALGAAVAALAACVTIQVYFPAARIQSMTEQIETEVERRALEATSQQGTPGPEVPPPGPPAGGGVGGAAVAPAPAPRPNPPRARLNLLELALGVRPAFAQDTSDVPPPDVSSPAIRALIASRAERVAELRRWKGSGVIGEGNDALVVARALDDVADLAQRAQVRRLVDAENADRRQLFAEIAAVEGVELSQLPRIQATYAQTLRRHARPGDWVQAADGKWAQVPATGE